MSDQISIKFYFSATIRAIVSLGFQVIPHPPKNPNLAPYDSDEKIKADVKRRFAARNTNNFIWTVLQHLLSYDSNALTQKEITVGK